MTAIAPSPNSDGISEISVLDAYSDLVVKESRRGCWQVINSNYSVISNGQIISIWIAQACCGCEAKTEALVATIDDRKNNKFYLMEDSGFCCRYWCDRLHPFSMNFSSGDGAGGKLTLKTANVICKLYSAAFYGWIGPVIARFDRPLRCPLFSCKCCCYQSISVTDASTNAYLGSASETCWYLGGPHFHVTDEVRV